MAETANLSLPLLAAGQAQKHVTLNEALFRLDHLLMLSVASRALAVPPSSAQEGIRYAVPTGSTGAWSGRTGQLAIWTNGGWDFIFPRIGWRAYVEDEALEVVFKGGIWTELERPVFASGMISVLEFEHQIVEGDGQVTAGRIPAGSLVFGVTARVLQTIGGVAGWSMGTADATGRFGSSLPVEAGASVRGATAAPLAYAAETPLRLTPEGGSFTNGRLKLNVHYLVLPAPSA